MTIIVGLGNPGKKYKDTRHNVGFQIIDEFAEKNNFPEFKFSKKFNALISENALNNEKIILAKPQTFMNNSGVAVKKITTNYKLQTINLIIVHDDIDLLLGKIRISKNRGSAGHKGVESIIKELGIKDFIRLRIGIGPAFVPLASGTSADKPKNVEKFVLQKFDKKEEEIIKEVIKETASELSSLN